MSYNEAETRYHLIDPVLRNKGYNDYQRLKLETPAPVEPTGPKGRRRKGHGRTDYLLCVQVGDMPRPLPVAVLEAKKESDDPLKGMQQAKGYSDCRRFDVKYVFATNGHRYGEFDKFSGLQGGPFPFPDFPDHSKLTARYAKNTGIDINRPEAAMLFMADSPAYPQSRYYQDAAIQPLKKSSIANKMVNRPAYCSAWLPAPERPSLPPTCSGVCMKPNVFPSPPCFCATGMNCANRHTTS